MRKETRQCLNCGKEFFVRAHNSLTSKKQLFCDECVKSLSDWERKTIKMKVFPEFRKNYSEQRRAEFLRRYKKNMIAQAKRRAINKGLEFSITEDDIIIPDICPILEVPIIIGTKGNYEYSPSLDRIDNTLGYIKGNVQVISKKANSMKNSASYKELKMFCKNVLRYSLNSGEDEPTESEDKEPQR